MPWSIPRGNVKHQGRQLRSQRTLEKRFQYVEGLTGGGVSNFTTAEVSDNYTLLQTDGFVRMTNSAGANKTMTLHATPTPQIMWFRNDSATYDMILDPAGSVQINGTTTYTVIKAFYVAVVWDGTAYWVVASV